MFKKIGLLFAAGVATGSVGADAIENRNGQNYREPSECRELFTTGALKVLRYKDANKRDALLFDRNKYDAEYEKLKNSNSAYVEYNHQAEEDARKAAKEMWSLYKKILIETGCHQVGQPGLEYMSYWHDSHFFIMATVLGEENQIIIRDTDVRLNTFTFPSQYGHVIHSKWTNDLAQAHLKLIEQDWEDVKNGLGGFPWGIFGIVFGVIFGVVLIVVIIVICCCCCNKKKNNTPKVGGPLMIGAAMNSSSNYNSMGPNSEYNNGNMGPNSSFNGMNNGDMGRESTGYGYGPMTPGPMTPGPYSTAPTHMSGAPMMSPTPMMAAPMAPPQPQMTTYPVQPQPVQSQPQTIVQQ